MRVQRLVACALALYFAVLVGAGQAPVGRVSADSKISLSVWLPDYCAPATQNFYKNTLLRDFAKAFPQISVQMVYVDWSVYDQKVATAFAGGTAPDVMQTGAEYVPNLVAKNQIRSIDPYLPAWGKKGDFFPGAWQNTMWQGRNYGVPYLSGIRGLVYRKSLLTAAGIAHPPTTWDELYTDAVKLTKHDAKGKLTQLGFQTYGSSGIDYWQQWLPYFVSAGGWPVTADSKKATINNPAGVTATTFFAKLFQAMTPGGVGLSSKLVAPFESGKVAMLISDASISAEVLQYNPKILTDVGVAEPLKGPGPNGKRAAIAYNDWLAITSQSKNPDAAWKFIAFVTQPSYLGAYDRTCGEIPTNKLAVKASWVTSNPVFKQFSEKVFPYAVAHPFYPHMTEMRDKVGSEVQKVAYGKESAPDAMKAAEAASNTVLGGQSTH